MSDVEINRGTPSMVFMPSREHEFTVSKDLYIITVPRKGNYYDLDPNFFTKEEGSFELYNEKTGVLYLPAISKVLFATSRYPDLNDNQFFAPLSMVFKEDVVEISGCILDMLIT